MTLANARLRPWIHFTAVCGGLLCGALLSGCLANPPKPAEPTRVAVQVSAGANINASDGGAPVPVALRLYALSSGATFGQADFFSLFERGDATLGTDVTHAESLVVAPGDSKQLAFEAPATTTMVGVVAGFWNVEASQWRASAPVVANASNAVQVTVEGRSVTVKGSVVPPAE